MAHLIKGVAVSAAFALIALTDSAASAGSQTSNLSVTATVNASCTISAGTLGFGSYDPVVANASTALNAQANISVTCTNGALTTITLGQGSNAAVGSTDIIPLRTMVNGGGNHLNYFLYSDSTRLVVWGNTLVTGKGVTGTGAAQNVTVYGTIPAAQSVPGGSYADTVVATITF